jgi:predicted enzyme related to lactoylglutathione lyase
VVKRKPQTVTRREVEVAIPNMFRKVAFTMYPVIDVDRARHFYEHTLGLTVGNAGQHDGKWWVEYDLPGGGCLALTDVVQDTPSASSGGTIAFEVADLDALMEDLKAKEVEFQTDIIDTPVCRMAVCLDSEGNGLLLHQLKPK